MFARNAPVLGDSIDTNGGVAFRFLPSCGMFHAGRKFPARVHLVKRGQDTVGMHGIGARREKPL
jgi:hypothetical protein